MNSLASYAAVVFDCDAVFGDTHDAWAAAERQLCEYHGVSWSTRLRRQTHGLSNRSSVALFADLMSDPPTLNELERQLVALATPILSEQARSLPGAIELVAELPNRIPVGVASNTPPECSSIAFWTASGLPSSAPQSPRMRCTPQTRARRLPRDDTPPCRAPFGRCGVRGLAHRSPGLRRLSCPRRGRRRPPTASPGCSQRWRTCTTRGCSWPPALRRRARRDVRRAPSGSRPPRHGKGENR